MTAGKNENTERVIDENLKRVFNATLEEGIPDRFKALLSQLKSQEAAQGQEK